MYLVLGIALTILGLVMLINPRLIFTLIESWKMDGDSEPSRRYLLETRIGGGIMTLVGVGCTVILLFCQ